MSHQPQPSPQTGRSDAAAEGACTVFVNGLNCPAPGDAEYEAYIDTVRDVFGENTIHLHNDTLPKREVARLQSLARTVAGLGGNGTGPGRGRAARPPPPAAESLFNVAGRMLAGTGISAMVTAMAQDTSLVALRKSIRQSLQAAAIQPAKDLAELLGHLPEGGVTLVAHSHGGVVLNRLFEDPSWPRLRSKVTQILAFGCPVVVREATKQ